jgi:hypothetical protein
MVFDICTGMATLSSLTLIHGKVAFGELSYISNDALSNMNITGSTSPCNVIIMNTTNGVYVGSNDGSIYGGSLTGFVTIVGTVNATFASESVYGYLNVAGAGSNTGPITAGYSLAMSGNAQALEFDATSDARLKNISGEVSTDDAIRFVKSISGKNYSWKHDPSDGIVTGFIAQDIDRAGFRHIVRTIANDSIVGNIDADGYVNPSGHQLTVNHNAILPYYHTVIQNLLARVEQLEATISSLVSSK